MSKLCHKHLGLLQFMLLRKNSQKRMKKIIVLIFLCSFLSGKAQFNKHLFSKDPIMNLATFQQQKVYFGFYLGFNSYDYKIDYKGVGDDIEVNKTTGFNVGVVADLRLKEWLNLRFEPGLYYTQRNLRFPNFTKDTQSLREVSGTYIHFPLLLKFSALRTGNVRPYLLTGLSGALNLSSNSSSRDDNSGQTFRAKKWTANYELGFGIDIFSEYFIFSPSIRGDFGINDELIRDADPNSPWTGNIASMKSRAVFINFTFH
jgi:Outer membrane protein beta-barrel domain